MLFCRCLFLLGFLVFPATAAEFHIRTDGVDDPSRSGLSGETAWASLAFACEQLPEDGEPHVIRIGPGSFTATRSAMVPSNVTITGTAIDNEAASRLIASDDWLLREGKFCKDESPRDCLIAIEKGKNVTVTDLELCSPDDRRIDGGIWVARGSEITLARLFVHDFRWNGLRLENSSNLAVHDCVIENASTEKCGFNGGLIRTRWLKESEIHHNRIVSTIGPGFGYKGGGHFRTRIHHNLIDVSGGFSIESAHDNEYDLEIDHNILTRCISVPKGGQGGDPANRECEYSVRIHHNLLQDSYTVEGPRNHLRIDHNYIHITKTNGRVYTHHGGINHGPVTIDHNVIENVDRSFVWMNRGLAENITVVHNTVLLADAENRTGGILGAYTKERLNNWAIRNNVFIAPHGRRFMPTQRGVPEKITATNNLTVGVSEVPEGNLTLDSAEGLFKANGAKPWPYYAPKDKSSPLVDAGAELKSDAVTTGEITGSAPDLGAFELEVPSSFGDLADQVGPQDDR